jgi:protein involved in polysaccharide export with SLBB domain
MKPTSRSAVHWFVLVLLAVSLIGSSAVAQATAGVDGRRTLLTREEIQNALTRLDELSRSTAYSSETRSRAQAEARVLRSRLDNGDYQTGDRIWLSVMGEEAATDTFMVTPQTTVALAQFGEVSLRGVLRSELEPHLRQHMAKYIREPIVQARSLLRITVTGDVLNPGFHAVPSEMLVTEAIMSAAGGLGPTAKIENLKIEREGDVLWEGAPLQDALALGRTLDQLSLQAGDRIVVPGDTGGALTALQAVAALVSVPVTILTLIALF